MLLLRTPFAIKSHLAENQFYDRSSILKLPDDSHGGPNLISFRRPDPHPFHFLLPVLSHSPVLFHFRFAVFFHLCEIALPRLPRSLPRRTAERGLGFLRHALATTMRLYTTLRRLYKKHIKKLSRKVFIYKIM